MTTDTKKKIRPELLDNTSVDQRNAVDAFMAVDRALTQAAIVSRALAFDASKIKDPEMSKAARRLLRLVSRVSSGPNVAFWTDIQAIEAAVERLRGED